MLTPGEAWSDAALDDLKGRKDTPAGRAWEALIELAGEAKSAKPTKKWRRAAGALLEEIGADEFKSTLVRWCGFTDRSVREPAGLPQAEPNQIVLRGLLWCCCDYDDVDVCRAIGALVEGALRRIRGVGPRSQKLANAGLFTLGEMPSLHAVAELSRLQSKVTQASLQKKIDAAIDAKADQLGFARHDLEDLVVPSYELDRTGRLTQSLGDCAAEIRVAGNSSTAELTWRRGDGRVLKSAPANVRREFAADVKALKQTCTDITKMIAGQMGRLERCFLAERQWSFGDWHRRYLEHPLLGHLARRLIWEFSDDARSRFATGVWSAGRLVGSDDQVIEWLRDDSDRRDSVRVRLWHPIGCHPQMVSAWRQWLEEHEVRQPFKQAHREVYVLTDAELETAIYSNRFAAHVLRQHQLSALCRTRGWRYRVSGVWYGDDSVATVTLPVQGLRAEFWVESPDHQHVADSGVLLYVSTDQVRFYEAEGTEAVRMEDVPPLVFSEIMRDVDLFVGVGSIGNDPNWRDRGEAGVYMNYWESYSFGDLSATARTRKQVLERLIPRLKIAPRCSFSDRFLIVRGDLRTYKIHLGSANILMEPNDQYLCIVRDRIAGSRRHDVFLPFEGDSTLALILSKAMLLAEDATIRDPTIVSQISAG